MRSNAQSLLEAAFSNIEGTPSQKIKYREVTQDDLPEAYYEKSIMH